MVQCLIEHVHVEELVDLCRFGFIVICGIDQPDLDRVIYGAIVVVGDPYNDRRILVHGEVVGVVGRLTSRPKDVELRERLTLPPEIVEVFFPLPQMKPCNFLSFKLQFEVSTTKQ